MKHGPVTWERIGCDGKVKASWLVVPVDKNASTGAYQSANSVLIKSLK